MSETIKALDTLTIDRRTGTERRQKNTPAVGRIERRKAPRRRQIDPTTCERDYSPEELEFMQAMDAYKRSNGRMFPTCSEVLEVIKALGYVKLAQDSPAVPAAPADLAQCVLA